MSCHAALFDQENEVTHPVEDAVPMVDQWMERGSLLRKLREMERQDALERRLSSHPLDEEEPSEEAGDHTAASTEAGGGAILNYASYLSHQRYHDDLKHVDYRFIDFGSALSTMIIEQDKCLGKGGFCWDAAHILGDYLASEQCLRRGSTVIELGCGTGLCGIMVAKSCTDVHVTLTDLPLLMPLVGRNLARNFCAASRRSSEAGSNPNETSTTVGDEPTVMYSESTGSTIQARVLEWSEDGSKDTSLYRKAQYASSYDVIVAADVVASIYNPTALARTVHRLAHSQTTVYISFKERLSTVHRQFEEELESLFGCVQYVKPTNVKNRNPQVQILVARAKRCE